MEKDYLLQVATVTNMNIDEMITGHSKGTLTLTNFYIAKLIAQRKPSLFNHSISFSSFRENE